MSYIRFCMLVLDFKKLHGTDHGLHGHKDILKDQFDETSSVLFGISRAMNDAHLFDKSGFTRFSGTWNRQMKIVSFRKMYKCLIRGSIYCMFIVNNISYLQL